MLDALDDIAWQALSHAYGPAVDVPGQIRALQSSDPRARERALTDLHQTIWHQGTVYGATAAAVPFLVALAADPATPDRVGILAFLELIADGGSYLDDHRSMGALDLRDAVPDFGRQLETELGWVRAARGAVEAGWERYLRLLDDPDAAVRAAAARLMGQFPARLAEDVARIMAVGTDRKAAVAATAALALTGIAGRMAVRDWLRERAADEGAPVPCRLAAAVALATGAPEQAGETEVALLTRAIAEPAPAPDVLIERSGRGYPWDRDAAQRIAAEALLHLAGRARGSLPALLNALDTPPVRARQIALTTLSVAFDGRPLPPGTPAAALTDGQRAALEGMVHRSVLWMGPNGNFTWRELIDALRALGLPQQRDALRRFLAGGEGAD